METPSEEHCEDAEVTEQLLAIVAEDFLYRPPEVANMTDADILSILRNIYYGDRFYGYDQHGSLEAESYYARERQKDKELAASNGNILSVEQCGDETASSSPLSLLVINVDKGQKNGWRAMSAQDVTPANLPVYSIQSDQLIAAIRAAA
jgi:hypothetical protein